MVNPLTGGRVCRVGVVLHALSSWQPAISLASQVPSPSAAAFSIAGVAWLRVHTRRKLVAFTS